MTKQEFTAKINEILDKGKIDAGFTNEPDIYYSEKSVLACMNWIFDNAGEIVEADTKKIAENIGANLENMMKEFEHKQESGELNIDEAKSKLPPGWSFIRGKDGRAMGISIGASPKAIITDRHGNELKFDAEYIKFMNDEP